MPRLFTILLISTLLLGLSACEQREEYQGYVEGDLTYISSPVSGKLINLYVDRGTPVTAGQPLFELEAQPELSSMQQALDTVDQLRATLTDLTKGERPSELAAIQGQIEATKAQLDYANIELKRRKALVAQAGVEQELLDQAIQNVNQLMGTMKQLQNNYITATLGSRLDQIKAAEAQLAGSKAALSGAEWRLSQKNVQAPVTATVFDRYYYVGEQVQAYSPVLSLLDPHNIKAIFFVPETDLAKIKLGQSIQVSCDSCQALKATISFISPNAEFTPPIIYSHETRTKLRYRVEARFSIQDRVNMHPGQPIDISIASA